MVSGSGAGEAGNVSGDGPCLVRLIPHRRTAALVKSGLKPQTVDKIKRAGSARCRLCAIHHCHQPRPADTMLRKAERSGTKQLLGGPDKRPIGRIGER